VLGRDQLRALLALPHVFQAIEQAFTRAENDRLGGGIASAEGDEIDRHRRIGLRWGGRLVVVHHPGTAMRRAAGPWRLHLRQAAVDDDRNPSSENPLWGGCR
jgi:hypothetical protein